MNKKKVVSLLIAGALAVGTVAGTFAWFTSQDSVTNKFGTLGQIDPEDPNGAKAGIEVWEKFDTVEANKATPGSAVDKKVQVKSTTDYNQFVRVKITPKFTAVPNLEGGLAAAENSLLQLACVNLAADLDSLALGQWIDGGDGYFYYNGVLAPADVTNQLLDTVTLGGNAGNGYKGSKYDVLVEAEGVQASNDAILAVWGDNDITQKINGSTLVDGLEIPGASHIHDTVVTP